MNDRMIARLVVAILMMCIAALGADKPNILLIMSDDMGFSDIGCYGGEVATPNLDQLAAEGLRFTQFYNTSRCCPTRASLLTGLYPHQAGMGHMTGGYSPRESDGYVGDINEHCLTIAQVLRPAGYATYACGKWHVAKDDGPKGPMHNWPLQRGFDRFYGTIKGGGNYYDPTALCRGNTYITPVNDALYKPDTFYYTNAIADNAVMFLKDHADKSPDKPFFMYIAFTAAHWPMHALPEDIAKYHGKYDAGYEPIRKARFERLKQLGLIDPSWDLSPQAGDWDKVKHKEWEARCMEVYAAMIDRMDQNIGHIIEELKREGQLDNTVIFFLQDNGGCAEGIGRGERKQPYPTNLKPMGPDELQTEIITKQTRDGRPVRQGPEAMPGPADTYISYGRDWANVSNTPFRQYKHFVHEGGISTPLIVHWPRGIDASRDGKLVTTPGHLIDLMATCIDLGGATYPKQANGHDITPMQGVSLRPTFDGKTIDRGRPIFWEHEGNAAVRDGKWKLVRFGNYYSVDGKHDMDWTLYDMEADRTEMHDVAAAHPDIVKRLAEAWFEWAQSSKVLPWPWKKDPGPVHP
ncbi:MAG: sulfatase-like hydrolase/transferase [Planctomycetes bacterium]|nr:sulfatase-like hydrolase/transferase [Planctomycetota bacterium]